jgi:hypothetical protein
MLSGIAWMREEVIVHQGRVELNRHQLSLALALFPINNWTSRDVEYFFI